MKFIISLLLGLISAFAATGSARASDNEPWKNEKTSLVIDAYELNPIDWEQLITNKRVAGFISKASDGLPEVYNCRGKHNGDSFDHCKTMWRKYAVSRELYITRKMLAKEQGLLWGAYHLGRPGSPIDQANHFLDYAKPEPDEMMVLDIESLDDTQFMSLKDAQIFARHIKTRTGRYPVLYINHDTARFIATNRDDYPLLSRLPLWYARYKPEIAGVFPMGNWENYMLWQFSSSSNCNSRHCPMRIEGTFDDIDVNTVPLERKELTAVWAKGELLPERPPVLQYLVSVSASAQTSTFLNQTVKLVAAGKQIKPVETALNYVSE